MPTEQVRQSIRSRFLAVLAAILLVSTVTLSVVIAFNQERTLEHSLFTKGQGLASYIGKLGQDPLLMKDSLQLDSIVNDANKDEDVVYAVIRDLHGDLLTSQYASINFRNPRIKAVLSGLSREADLPAIISAIRSQLAVSEISEPVLAGVKTVGTVTIGMSRYRVREQVAKTVLFVLAINLIVAVAMGILLFVSSQKIILTPVSELANAATRLAKGDLATRVNVNTIGEVKTLVDSFNRMADDLQKTTVSRDYVDNIINSMLDTLIVLSPEGTVLRANAAAGQLLLYEPHELHGMPFGQILAETPANSLTAMLSRGPVSATEKVYRTKDGRNVPVLFSASAMRNPANEIQAIVCAAQDISDRKRAEMQLKSSSEELAEINEELKNFAYIVSHDLRAPLLNIKGFSQELDRSLREIEPCFRKHLPLLDGSDRDKIGPILSKEVPEALHFIGSSVIRMDSLIGAILKLSRAGRRKISAEPVNAGELVQDILASLAHQISSRSISVRVGELPEVVSDRTALEQIFANLIDNAVKYTDPDRPGRITIRGECSSAEAVYHIEDNGQGIREEDIPRAFEIFRRVGRQDVPGEGVGLAYVKTLVRLLGGRLWCTSQPGTGSVFSFSIPADNAAESPDRNRLSPA